MKRQAPIPRAPSEGGVGSYSVGAVSRATGLSPDLIRAWERRYGALRPDRSAGGTRRYGPSDVRRLRLLRAAMQKGHAIGEIAGLDDPSLEALTAASDPNERAGDDAVTRALAALERLDSDAAERIISLQLSALGPLRFARGFAAPLMVEIGRAWAGNRLFIAAEHLGTELVRSLLGTVLAAAHPSPDRPCVLFATPPGERHDLGLMIAAVVALSSGARPVLLGTELPLQELGEAAARLKARALALGITMMPIEAAERAAREAREAVPAHVDLWVGGRLAGEMALPSGVERVRDLDELEQMVLLLEARAARREEGKRGTGQ